MNQTKFQELYEEFKDKISDKDIKEKFDAAYYTTKNSDVFLVTVVGTVNAGKSTFFNCLIHKDISEIKGGENTIRPNLVFNSPKETYKTFKKKDVNEPIDINQVLKYLFDPKKNDISNQLEIEERSFEVAKKNQNIEQNYLFTSFGINLKINDAKENRIVFVDMPGNDGIKAEEYNDSFYDFILKRTDLVILVCSSSDDISIAMREYIKSICESNIKVPFVVVLNQKDDKGDFEGEIDESESKLRDSISRLGGFRAKIDKEISGVLNAYHVFSKLQGKKPKEEAANKVEESCKDFEKFENNLTKKYFTNDFLKGQLSTNNDYRLQSQIDNLKNTIDRKISELKEEISIFNEEIEKLTPSEGSKTDITSKLNDESSQTKLNNANDTMGECAKKYTHTSWFLKSRVVNVLKNEYVPQHLSKELKQIFDDYIENFVKQLEKNINNSKWNGAVSYDNKQYEYKFPILKDKDYKKCIEFCLFNYNRDDLERAMKELKRKLLNYGEMGEQILHACDEIAGKYFGEIREKEEIDEKENLLMTLQTILKRIS